MQGDVLSQTIREIISNPDGTSQSSESVVDAVRALFTCVLESSVDPTIIFDSKWRVLGMNTPAEDLFLPNSMETSEQLTADTLIHSQELLEFLYDGKLLTEWTVGEEKTYLPRLQLSTPTAGLTLRILILRDFTQFKKLNRNQHEFMRIVSHDLRSPLTSMLGFANMLELGLVGDLNEKQSQFVERIMSGINQMTALVENIQDAGRFDPETGFYEMMRSHCDLAEIVTRIVKNHLVPAEKQELTISVRIDDGVPIINADMNMLERAITNLVDNAIKYTPNGGTVEVSVTVQNEALIIGVHDTGYGISAENQKLLFQRHVRLPRQEHKKIKGSGLGLFIVKSVAQRHGGDAWVESEEGKGSTFYFSIPLKDANQIFPT